jgi:Protein of unknown function (DUF2892)
MTTDTKPALMTSKVKLHDGIVGAIVLASVGLAWTVNPLFMWLAGLTGAIMISSAFTGFCPVHFAVSKLSKG